MMTSMKKATAGENELLSHRELVFLPPPKKIQRRKISAE